MSISDMVINQIKSSIEKKLKSLDVNHDGHPDLPELLQHFEDGIKTIEPVLAKIQPADLSLVLNALNNVLGNKLSSSEITLVEQSLESVGKGLALLENICAELTSTNK